MIAISTLVSEDGVIGLNGKRYLLDENEELMLFKSVDEAKQFVKDMDKKGECMFGEYIEYEEHKSEIELWGK